MEQVRQHCGHATYQPGSAFKIDFSISYCTNMREMQMCGCACGYGVPAALGYRATKQTLKPGVQKCLVSCILSGDACTILGYINRETLHIKHIAVVSGRCFASRNFCNGHRSRSSTPRAFKTCRGYLWGGGCKLKKVY